MKMAAADKKDEMEKDKQTIGFGAGNLEAKTTLLAQVQKNVRVLGKDRDGTCRPACMYSCAISD